MIAELYYCNVVIFDIPLDTRHGDESSVLSGVNSLY